MVTAPATLACVAPKSFAVKAPVSALKPALVLFTTNVEPALVVILSAAALSVVPDASNVPAVILRVPVAPRSIACLAAHVPFAT